MRDVERDLLERGELGEVHLTRLDAEQMRVLARLGTERRHDLRRHREEAMPVQTEPVRRGAEDSFEARSGVAVGVQRAGELEHEADGERIGLAEVQLGRRLEDVVAQGTRGAGTALMLLPSSPNAMPYATMTVTAAAPTARPAVRPTLSCRRAIEATSARGRARRSRGLSARPMTLSLRTVTSRSVSSPPLRNRTRAREIGSASACWSSVAGTGRQVMHAVSWVRRSAAQVARRSEDRAAGCISETAASVTSLATSWPVFAAQPWPPARYRSANAR